MMELARWQGGSSMSDLKGKVAVVTGASKGIGAAIAKGLSAAGAAVAVNYSSSKEGADRIVADIKAKGGKAIAIEGNVAKAADVRRLFEETKKAFDRLDVLVNNAGVYKFLRWQRSPRMSSIASSTSTCWVRSSLQRKR
jgi:3-oxoacyl-[acyl-carrier protein] reductase